ncbi:uncharacterized protein [Setaria viridis]|uniref:uncharacterized protein n=1 Tax=Setaria viridis TaxID=4556 RepID=UPI003B3B417E
MSHQSGSSSSDDSDESLESLDLDDDYKDFMAEQEAFDSIAEAIESKLKSRHEEETIESSRRRRSNTRIYILRDREHAHEELVSQYFSEDPIYTDFMFRTRFRMRRSLFLRIVDALGKWSQYFTQRTDATNRKGLSPLIKCTAAMRMLAYGTPADSLDENLKIGKSTTLECLGIFAQGVIETFGPEFLRPPTVEETERILQFNESRGFPGMLGSIDCMHWVWKNCPVAWRGQYTSGKEHAPTMILEAVATHDLRIWHSYFGVAGANNDINVLNHSPLFIQALKGEAPKVYYSVNGTQYNAGYYLADGIYPQWAAFVKSIAAPQSEKDKLYAQAQESARKDIERAFGVLQSRFNIVDRPARKWKQVDVGKIMQACIILHNMIIEDQRQPGATSFDLNSTPGLSYALPPGVSIGNSMSFAEVLRRNAAIRDRETHTKLRNDLVEHIWHCSRKRQNS